MPETYVGYSEFLEATQGLLIEKAALAGYGPETYELVTNGASWTNHKIILYLFRFVEGTPEVNLTEWGPIVTSGWGPEVQLATTNKQGTDLVFVQLTAKRIEFEPPVTGSNDHPESYPELADIILMTKTRLVAHLEALNIREGEYTLFPQTTYWEGYRLIIWRVATTQSVPSLTPWREQMASDQWGVEVSSTYVLRQVNSVFVQMYINSNEYIKQAQQLATVWAVHSLQPGVVWEGAYEPYVKLVWLGRRYNPDPPTYGLQCHLLVYPSSDTDWSKIPQDSHLGNEASYEKTVMDGERVQLRINLYHHDLAPW